MIAHELIVAGQNGVSCSGDLFKTRVLLILSVLERAYGLLGWARYRRAVGFRNAARSSSDDPGPPHVRFAPTLPG